MPSSNSTARALPRAPQSIQLITFDLDGTLVDTAAEIAEAANRTLADCGLPQRCLADVTRLIGHGTHELMKGLLVQAGEHDLRGRHGVAGLQMDAVMKVFERHYQDTTGTDSRLYAGCLQGLECLYGAGVQMACVTNKEIRFARRVLEVTGLQRYFPQVIGGDSLAHKKPHPLVIEHCLQLLNVLPSQAAHLGDSSIDVETARRAGVAAWAVPYGYNGGQCITLAQPDVLFNSILEVAEHVVQLRCAA